LSAGDSTRGSTRGGFASGEGSALGGNILKWKEKQGNFSRKAGFPREGLLDYGGEINLQFAIYNFHFTMLYSRSREYKMFSEA